MNPPTYIVGHRNPDVDAICSAIGYAAFKQQQGFEHFEAIRCGNSNARIDAVLQRFGVAMPRFVGDVTPRLRDIMIRDIFQVRRCDTCTDAVQIFDDHDVRVLPVTGPDNRLEGTLSVFRLGEFFIPNPREVRQMRRTHTNLNHIVRSTQAQVLHLAEPERMEDLFVRIGAMDIRSFGKFAHQEDTPTAQTIVVVGDRWDIQLRSIQLGVRLVVVTGGLNVDEEVVAEAKRSNVGLIVSPFDSATTSGLIRLATQVDSIMEPASHTFSPDEKLGAVRRKVAKYHSSAYMVVDEEDRLLGVFSKADLIKPVATQLVLVDHNEISQAVPGAGDVRIAEIIDHHRLGNIPTEQPILFINEPVGSTCTIVADQFRRQGLTPEPAIAGILMSGIIADTLHLNSPTSTAKDAEILPWLAGIAEVEPSEMADIMFSAGSVILSESPERVIRSDMKLYHEGDVRYSVSQVEELGLDNFRGRHESLLEALEGVREKESLFFAALLVTDINSQNSLLAVKGDEEVIEGISYAPTELPEVFDLPGIVSRKKQVIPYLTGLLRSLGVGAAAGSVT